LGLGLMGKPMVSHLLSANYKLFCYNRSKDKVDSSLLSNANFSFYSDPLPVFENADELIFSMLFDAPSTVDLLKQIPKKLLEHKTFVCMSTISPKESKEFNKFFTENNGHYIEAPVLGNCKVAAAAKLQVLIGANDNTLFEKYKTIFSLWGTPREIGTVGKATTCKLALNQILGSLVTGFANSLALVEKNDVPVDLFMSILTNGPFNNPYFTAWKQKMGGRDYDSDIVFTLSGALKDIILFEEVAEDSKINYETITATKSLLEKKQKEFGGSDFAAIYEAVNPKPQQSNNNNT